MTFITVSEIDQEALNTMAVVLSLWRGPMDEEDFEKIACVLDGLGVRAPSSRQWTAGAVYFAVHEVLERAFLDRTSAMLRRRSGTGNYAMAA